jgi:hypothetical protein
MKKTSDVIFLLILVSAILYSLLTITDNKFLLADSLARCCDFGYLCNNTDCSLSSTMHRIDYSCVTDVELTCKDCMYARLNGLICGQTDNPYYFCYDGNYKYSSWCGYELPINVDIVGSHFAGSGVTSYFTTSASGGCTSHYPYHYQWRLYIFCDNDNLMDTKQDPVIDSYPCGSWINVGSDSPDYSFASDKNYKLKCTLYDNFSVNSPFTTSEWNDYIMEK